MLFVHRMKVLSLTVFTITRAKTEAVMEETGTNVTLNMHLLHGQFRVFMKQLVIRNS